jgi:hypothetical protein
MILMALTSIYHCGCNETLAGFLFHYFPNVCKLFLKNAPGSESENTSIEFSARFHGLK